MKNKNDLRKAALVGAAFGASLLRARILLSPAAGTAVAGTLDLAAESLKAAALDLGELVAGKPDAGECARLGRAYVKALRDCLESDSLRLDAASRGTLEEILARAEEAAELVAMAAPLYRCVYDDGDGGPALP
jgi:hypothetical protein